MERSLKLFLCFKCDQSFFSTVLLLQHIKFCHPYSSKYSCKQSNCFRSFKDLNGLRKHLKKQHLGNEKHKELIIDNMQQADDKDFAVNPNFNTTLLSDNPTTSTTSPDNNHSTFTNQDNDIFMLILSFISKLNNNSSVNRSVVQEVITYTKELVEGIFSFTKTTFEGINDSFIIKNKLDEIYLKVSENFHQMGTEYLRFKYLQTHNLFAKPTKFTIGTEIGLSQINTSGEPKTSIRRVTGQLVNISNVLKQFLELPKVFKKIENFILEEETMSPEILTLTSIFQGNLWKTLKQSYGYKKVFPLFLYFHDFEPLNVLGSRAGNYKIGGVYISLACIPPEYASLIENIFLTQLFYSSDRTLHSNKKIFQNLINDLKALEDQGLTLNIINDQITVYFSVISILGDNLGLNSILGFSESFNSDFFCRFCLASKLTSQTEIHASNFIKRTKENYNKHSTEKSHGVKEVGVWNELRNFHVTENLSCDLMHDMLLGILRYDMALIINALIKSKYFSLTHLNERIKFFKFSKADIGNQMPQIKPEHLKKKIIIISASEMMSLVAYFGIIVGDLVPENDEVWNFYILTVQILNNLLSRSFSQKSIEYLSTLIEEHHSLVISLFNEHLRPKYHLLLHYPEIINLLGPPRYYWSMRYESFHRLLKCTANSVACRKNLLVTMSWSFSVP